MISVRNAEIEIQQQQHQRFWVGDILTWGHFDCTLSKSSPPSVWGRLPDRTARNGEDMMRILADYMFVFKPIWATDTGENRICSRGSRDTRCFQFNCHYRMEDRMFRTTLVIRAFTKIKDSNQSLQRTAISSCQQMLTKTLNTKVTAMSICSTYGQERT